MRAEDILPGSQDEVEHEGLIIRKGTVGAFLANARVWLDANASQGAREVAERHIVEGIPALKALQLFEVLAIRDAALARLVDSH